MKRQLSPADAEERLRILCNASEQCSYDLRRKLAGWGISSGNAEMILKRLEESRLLDDSRFAHAYARSHLLYNRWGNRKIRAMLAGRRIDRQTIDEAIGSLDEEEYRAAALAVMRAAFRGLGDPADYAVRMKALRRGAARGFEPALLIEIIESGAVCDD